MRLLLLYRGFLFYPTSDVTPPYFAVPSVVGGLVVHEVSSPMLAKMSVDGVLFIVWVTLSLTLTLAVGMMTCLRQFSL